MEKIEIKLDKTTLPKNNERVVFETYEVADYVGYYCEEENAFIPLGKLPITAYNVITWGKLKIDWEFKEWGEKKESLGWLVGFDKFENKYTATGIMNGTDEILEVQDIENACSYCDRTEICKGSAPEGCFLDNSHAIESVGKI